jgi:putative restriction endonuclease
MTIFFLWLIMESSREKLREKLITNYFAERVQPVLKEQAYVNRDASRYGTDLLKTADASFVYAVDSEKDEQIFTKVRNHGFRKAIVSLYEHRCALCGISMLTPEGHTIVEAAHIVPWSTSHDDRPQNGMAPCRLYYWSFDEVLISKTVRQDNNFPGHMETLSGRAIFNTEEQ